MQNDKITTWPLAATSAWLWSVFAKNLHVVFALFPTTILRILATAAGFTPEKTCRNLVVFLF
mgnify:CR=1 FL=1